MKEKPEDYLLAIAIGVILALILVVELSGKAP